MEKGDNTLKSVLQDGDDSEWLATGADYTAALQVVGANKPMLLRNRAFCYGKLGRHAEALADFLSRSFGRNAALVNLIPYNENGLGLPGGELFRASEQESGGLPLDPWRGRVPIVC